MICRLWHALPDDSQSHFLNAQWDGSWDGDGEGPSEVAHRTEWFFAGQRVCVTALCGLLGVGNKSLMKKVQGVVDMRQRLNSTAAMPRATVQTNLVDMFLICEQLPSLNLVCSRSVFSVPLSPWQLGLDLILMKFMSVAQRSGANRTRCQSNGGKLRDGEIHHTAEVAGIGGSCHGVSG